jgi:hypothetical protein
VIYHRFPSHPILHLLVVLAAEICVAALWCRDHRVEHSHAD